MIEFITLPNISLFFQLVGAIILGWAIALTPDDVLKALSGTYFDYNKHFLEALIKQRTDARFGVIVLALGILVQLVENLFSLSQKLSPECISNIGLISTVVFFTSFFFVRKHICNAKIRQLTEELNQEAPGD